MDVELHSDQNLKFVNVEFTNSMITKICAPASHKKYCERYMELLRDALCEKFCGKRPRHCEDFFWPIKVRLAALPEAPNVVECWIISANERNGKCLIHNLDVIFGGPVTSKIQIGFSLRLIIDGSESSTFEIERKPCNLSCFRLVLATRKVHGVDAKIENGPLYDALASGYTVLGDQLILRLHLNEEHLEILRLESVKDPLSINRKLLTDTDSMDAVIIAGNGGTVNCHRIFLAAHSPVFKAMFENSMTEGVTGTLKLADMSEPSVRALVKYLYTWELTEATIYPAISIELLIAAEKYGINRLEVDARELILSKKKEWFSVGSLIQLLHFAKVKLAGGETGKDAEYELLEQKTAQLIKSMSPGELNECKEYQELFSDPVAGMEFCTYMITTEKKIHAAGSPGNG